MMMQQQWPTSLPSSGGLHFLSVARAKATHSLGVLGLLGTVANETSQTQAHNNNRHDNTALSFPQRQEQ